MVTRFPGGQEIARKWFVVDAQGQTLGRLATRVASILAGKESPQYTPFLDTGDHVIEAILGMLPKSKLGRAMGKKLKVYVGDKHQHQAQKPQSLELAGKKQA
jgi:large subunit ribosomal protein L13